MKKGIGRPGSLLGLAALLSLPGMGIACGGQPPYQGKSVAALEAMLHDSDPAVQAQGAFGLSLQGAEAQAAVRSLRSALESPHVAVREKAALALGQVGPGARDAVPALIAALADTEWTVRRQAALALGNIGADAQLAVPALEKLRS